LLVTVFILVISTWRGTPAIDYLQSTWRGTPVDIPRGADIQVVLAVLIAAVVVVTPSEARASRVRMICMGYLTTMLCSGLVYAFVATGGRRLVLAYTDGTAPARVAMIVTRFATGVGVVTLATLVDIPLSFIFVLGSVTFVMMATLLPTMLVDVRPAWLRLGVGFTCLLVPALLSSLSALLTLYRIRANNSKKPPLAPLRGAAAGSYTRVGLSARRPRVASCERPRVVAAALRLLFGVCVTLSFVAFLVSGIAVGLEHALVKFIVSGVPSDGGEGAVRLLQWFGCAACVARLLVHNWLGHSLWEVGGQASAYWLALLVTIGTWEGGEGGGGGGGGQGGGVDRRLRRVAYIQSTAVYLALLACYATNRRRQGALVADDVDHPRRGLVSEWATTQDDVALALLKRKLHMGKESAAEKLL
jgi:hypothetical protein